MRFFATTCAIAVTWTLCLQAQQSQTLQRPPNVERSFSTPDAYLPDMTQLSAATSELRDVVERFSADRQAILRFYTIPVSKERRDRLRGFYQAWLTNGLPKVAFDRLSQEGKVDYVLLRNHIEYQLALLGREERRDRESLALLPFADAIVTLQEDRQKLHFISAETALAAVSAIAEDVKRQSSSVASQAAAGKVATPQVAARAAQQIGALRGALDGWFGFYNGYDPAFTKQVPEKYRELTRALDDYARVLREKVAGLPPAPLSQAGGRGGRGGGAAAAQDDITGDPIGRDGLMEDLAGEMIVYTPEELIAIGEREYAWCEAEMKKAAREMGFGDNWMKALEHVKNQYVPRCE